MTRRPLVIAAAVVAVVVLAGAVFVGHRAYVRHRDSQAACDTVKDTESTARAERRRVRDETRDLPTVAFLGDSYTQGQWLTDPTQGFPYVAADKLGVSPAVSGSGGSGLLNEGPCGHATLADRLQDVATSDVQAVVVQTGLNDLANSDDEESAATDLLATIKDDAPDAALVVVGPPDAPGVDMAAIAKISQALMAAATSSGATFVDLRDLDITFDPTSNHPDVDGHQVIGDAVAAAVTAAEAG